MNSKTILSGVLASVCALGSFSVLADPESGSDLRWFEVEVILFRQDATHQSDPEQFPLTVNPVPLQRYYDPLSDWYEPSDPTFSRLLPACDQTDYDWLPILPVITNDIERAVASLDSPIPRWCREAIEDALVSNWYLPGGEYEESVQRIQRKHADTVINGRGGDMHTTRSPFLMPSSSHELTSVRQRVDAQGDKETLLHVAWRQPVYTRTQGRKIRLYGGYDFTPDFDYLGYKVELPDTVFEESSERTGQADRIMNIDTLLAQVDNNQFEYRTPDATTMWLPERPTDPPANIPAESWELDGLIHIYLVGNYLHIDGEFNRREVITLPIKPSSFEEQAQRALDNERSESPFLRSYYFKQLRRVISHETHYFDHPHMGMIVQIRRTSLSHRR